jgi:protein-S-isoprenylcysteine O-methyltransferase Ste14
MPDSPARGTSVAVRALVVASAFVALWVWLAASVRRFDALLPVTVPPWLRSVGWVVAAAGAVLGVACVAAFVTRGRGTPAPFDPPRQFVAAGPYRWVRNPMYVGGVGILLGAGLGMASPSIIALAAVAFAASHLFVVLYEEPTLARRFGDSYLRYRTVVRRWVVHPPTGPPRGSDDAPGPRGQRPSP